MFVLLLLELLVDRLAPPLNPLLPSGRTGSRIRFSSLLSLVGLMRTLFMLLLLMAELLVELLLWLFLIQIQGILRNLKSIYDKMLTVFTLRHCSCQVSSLNWFPLRDERFPIFSTWLAHILVRAAQKS